MSVAKPLEEAAGEERMAASSPLFRKASWALFAAGFTIFGLLYYVQSLLPVFSGYFGVTPAESSLALSATTGVMAFALLLSGIVSDVVGRKAIMVFSLLSSAILTVLMAFAPSWEVVIGIRLLMGITLSGVQAVAMAYLAEEIEPRAFGMSLGLFISGSALGGMVGRLVVSVITDFTDWRMATGFMGAVGVIASLYFWKNLPRSRFFIRTTPGLKALMEGFGSILKDRVFVLLFVMGFLLMGGFVTSYNYITYRLVDAPFGLSQTFVGLIFLVYLTGIFGSTWIGDMASKRGHSNVLWIMLLIMLSGLLLTLPDHLFIVMIGLALLTFGFFSGHSVASGWVSRRAARNRALAASLYLFAYYQGSAILGTSGGFFWQGAGWGGVVALTASLAFVGLLIALYLQRTAPRP